MMRIDPATLSRADAIAFRESELARLESARLVAGIARGPLKRKARQAIAAHHANIMALSDVIDGPLPPCDLSDKALLDELARDLEGIDATQ